MITDSFRKDLQFLGDLLQKKTPFALTRFGDGEMMIMQGTPLNLLHKGEFNYNGEEELKQDLNNSFTYNQENYFVGVACPCCVGPQNSNWMKTLTGLPDKQLTWANIFVNANYPYFREHIVPLFNSLNVSLIAQSTLEGVANLPFKVENFYQIGPNAWVNDTHVYENIRQDILQNKQGSKLFLFCAGPYANILCHKLYKEFKDHTFIDIGSVFNVELGIGANRGYLKGAGTLNKICKWN